MNVILFYSNSCKICNHIKLLEIFKRLNKVRVDNKAIRNRIPSYITEVPSLVIKKKEGDLNLLTGMDVLKWCQMMNNNNDIGGSINNSNETNQNQNQNQSTNNPNDLGTISDNLGGFSDNFSFIDTGDLHDSGGSNFSFIDGTTHNASITTPLDTNVNTSAIDKDYNKLLQERATL